MKKVVKDFKKVWTILPEMSANSYLTQKVSSSFFDSKSQCLLIIYTAHLEK